MGRPSLIEQHDLGALIVALQADGTTGEEALSKAILERTGIKVSPRTVGRWVAGETGSVAQAARRVKPSTNGHAKPPPPVSAAEPVALEGDDTIDDRLGRAMLAVVEDTSTPLEERRRWAEQLIYHRHLLRHGVPP
jgi:hypothetical protein